MNSPGQPFDQLKLALVLERDRPVGDLEVLQAELVHPRNQLLEATAADRKLGERAAEHDGNPVVPVALELALEVAGRERGTPSELDDVDELAGDLDHPVDLRGRQPAVDHVGHAA